MPKKRTRLAQLFPFSWRDLFITILVFLCATGLCALLQRANSSPGFAAPVFVLAVLLVSRLTTGYLFGLIASVLGVACNNFIFTFPYWSVNFTLAGYPLTFLVFLSVSVVTCALTTRVREQERMRAGGEKEKLRANLLRSVSHDIRTPLTSIVGSADAILENPGLSQGEQRELLQDIHDEAQWLIRVVENLLSITRMGDAQARITTAPEAAEEVLGEAARKFRKRFPEMQVSVSVPEALLMVPMDAILIEQVLANLMENAATHGGTTTHIRLSLAAEGPFARFTVADNGQGIPEDALATLFDGGLRQVEGGAGDGKRNMGLGLSVCLAIVRAHGGDMSARNLSGGAEFTFRLPLSKEVPV